MHLGVSIPATKWTDGTDNVTFGPPVPQVVMTANVVPAGSHRGKAVTESLRKAKKDGFGEEAVVDPGYSMLNKYIFHMLLMQFAMPLVMQPASHQRTRMLITPQSLAGGLVLDGQLFSRHTPSELWYLSAPERSSTTEERKTYRDKFKQRGAYAYVRHKAPGADGITRWKCPFCVGKLRSRQLPHTMRLARSKPLVTLPEGEKCCEGTVSVGADQLPLMQRTIFGTPAWAASYGRRNAVESVNAAFKGQFTSIDRGFVRSLQTVRILLLFAHTIAGYNRWAVQSWQKLQRHLADVKQHTRKIRKPRERRLKKFSDFVPPTSVIDLPPP